MKGMRSNAKPGEVFIGDLDRGVIAMGVKRRFHDEARARGGRRNQADDGLMTDQGLAAPVLGDEAKEPMLDLVPFTRAWRKVTDRQRQPHLVGQPLEGPLPETRPMSVAAAAIGRDQQGAGAGEPADLAVLVLGSIPLHGVRPVHLSRESA